MNPVLLVLLAYLLGSIPSSHLMARWGHGVDLTRKGSGNLGATNVFRVLGWKAALPVAIVDVGKGWLPAWLFTQLDTSAVWAWALAYGAAAILGHVFSIWVGFQGGKGVATSTGVFLAVAPMALLVGLAVWLVLALSTRIVSVASMSAAVTVAVVIWIRAPADGGAELRLFAVALAAFVLWSHRDNIRRLVQGEEKRFGSDSDEVSTEGPDRADEPAPSREHRTGADRE